MSFEVHIGDRFLSQRATEHDFSERLRLGSFPTGRKYEIIGFTERGGIRFKRIDTANVRGVWSKWAFEEYINTGRLKKITETKK